MDTTGQRMSTSWREMINNVPDDYHTYQVTCETCGVSYHPAEGDCECDRDELYLWIAEGDDHEI